MLDQIYSRNRFYMTKLNDAGLAPSDLRSLDDLACLPFTTKSELLRVLQAVANELEGRVV